MFKSIGIDFLQNWRIDDYRQIMKTVLRVFLIVLLLIIFIRYFQSRLNLSDLKVYYGATRKLFALPLNTDLFGPSILNTIDNNPYHFYYGLPSGYYKYAPFFLCLFYPISLISWPILQLIYPILSILGVYLLFKGIVQIFSSFTEKYLDEKIHNMNVSISFILALVLQTHNIYREILIGNINIYLMLCLVYFLIFNSKNKIFLSTLCLSLLVCIKPHFIFIPILLLFYKKYKAIFYYLMLSILFFVFPAVLFGYERYIGLMQGWLHAMSIHNSDAAYIKDPLTLQYLLWKIYPLLCVKTIIMTVTCLTFFVLFWKKKIYLADEKYLTVFSLFLSAVVPFIFLVDTNQLLYIFPFSVYLFYQALAARWFKKISIPLLIAYIAVILSQQIPGDWFPAYKFVGGAYLFLFLLLLFPHLRDKSPCGMKK